MLKKIITVSILAVFVFGFVGGIFTLSENRVQAAEQKSNVLNEEQAIKIVKEKYTDVQVKSVEKELENGKTVYEVEFTDSNGSHEINIDAGTGEILKSFEDEKTNYQNENGEDDDSSSNEDD